MARYCPRPIDPLVLILRAIDELREKHGYQVTGRLDFKRGVEEHHVQFHLPASPEEER